MPELLHAANDEASTFTRPLRAILGRHVVEGRVLYGPDQERSLTGRQVGRVHAKKRARRRLDRIRRRATESDRVEIGEKNLALTVLLFVLDSRLQLHDLTGKRRSRRLALTLIRLSGIVTQVFHELLSDTTTAALTAHGAASHTLRVVPLVLPKTLVLGVHESRLRPLAHLVKRRKLLTVLIPQLSDHVAVTVQHATLRRNLRAVHGRGDSVPHLQPRIPHANSRVHSHETGNRQQDTKRARQHAQARNKTSATATALTLRIRRGRGRVHVGGELAPLRRRIITLFTENTHNSFSFSFS